MGKRQMSLLAQLGKDSSIIPERTQQGVWTLDIASFMLPKAVGAVIHVGAKTPAAPSACRFAPRTAYHDRPSRLDISGCHVLSGEWVLQRCGGSGKASADCADGAGEARAPTPPAAFDRQ